MKLTLGDKIKELRKRDGRKQEDLAILADDELLEVTPESLRIRKTILNHEKRMKAIHGKKK